MVTKLQFYHLDTDRNATIMANNSDNQAIAQRYSTALFELAEEKKKLKPLSGELEALQAMLKDSDALNRLCTDPTIPLQELAGTIKALTKKAKFSSLLENFLYTLAENGRMEALPSIIKAFFVQLHSKNDELVAEVITAVKMKKTQTTRLEKILKAHFGKKVTLQIEENAALLGGLRIRVGGQLIDASVQGRLQRMESHLQTGIQQIV
jgi:F-type H+-transporting ATPase subunit delta